MDRRTFMHFAALGTASLVGQPAFSQGRSGSILIASELNSNSLDTHTAGANRGSYGLCMMIYDRLIQFGVKTLPNGVQSWTPARTV